MHMKWFLVLGILVLAACSNTDTEGDKSYNHPSSNASKMSSDTLCYRAAGAKENNEVKAEIRARGLDCAYILENDPLMNFQRY
jgi:hypothetical protein